MSESVQTKDVRQSPAPGNQVPVPLQAEEVEAVIAPGLASTNLNENVLAARLDVEEVEAVIAPGLASTNHNETVLE